MSLYGEGVVDEDDEFSDEEHPEVMSESTSVTVVLSAMRWKVVFREFDVKVAVIITPPGRLVLSGLPYWKNSIGYGKIICYEDLLTSL